MTTSVHLEPSDPLVCPQCGRALPADAPAGNCPACLAGLGLLSSEGGVAAPNAPTSPEQKPVGIGKTVFSAAADAPLLERPGERIGRYKLLQKIGEGGCGVVYVAEQEEPVRRRVALKVVKLGMDTRQVVARFEAERQALAMMDHPNIAKVHDGGTTEAGRPYFVMELVRGVRITEYCDENNLSTEQRLDLFMQVCQAVQHAHQKGVIHRDLKPSNILVTINDGMPVPKVIDFGVAKAIEQRLTDKTIFTEFHQFIGTPAYMSPEQALMTSLDIDTRSDIYSLGVLLYELLTGRTPLDTREMLKAGVDEMRRSIRELEPPRPSNRLSTLSREDLTSAAKRRSTNPPQLVHAVSGDLDWIVMKCLEKDRTRRYETASGLAADIQRHLKNEPITARPPSRLYQFQKLARRNRVAFAAVVGVSMALGAGAIVSTWQAMLARKATAAALAAKRKADATAIAERAAQEEAKGISKFLTEIFQSPDPARDGRTITVFEMLDRTAKKLDTDLSTQPARKAKLQSTLGLTYIALGLPREAVALQEKALNYYRAASGPEHSDTLQAMNMLGISYFNAGRRKEAIQLQEAAVSLSQKVKGPEDPLTLLSKGNLAKSYWDEGQWTEAMKMQEELLSLNRKVNGSDHFETLRVMHNLALSYYDAGRRDEAIQLQEEVLSLCRKLHGPEHPRTLIAMGNLAVSYSESNAKNRKDALKMREEVLRLSRKVNGPDHPDTRNAIINMKDSYLDQERYADAEQLFSESLMEARKSAINNPSRLESQLSDMADLRARQGQFPSAESFYRETLESRRRRLPADHDEVVKASASLGQLLADWAWAERSNSVAADIRRLNAKSESRESNYEFNQNLLASAAGRPVDRAREAERLLRECLALRRQRTNATPWKTSEWQSRVGSALVSVAVTDPELSSTAREAKLAEAETLLVESNEAVQKNPASEVLYKQKTLERLIRLYEALNKPAQAAQWRAKLDAFNGTDRASPPTP